MKKYVSIVLLCALAGCAYIPIFGRSPTPETPVFFKQRSARLDQPALHAIQTAARYAAAQPGAPVSITGAADSSGDTAANAALSAQRAQAVAETLVADGVAVQRIHIHAIGTASAPEPQGVPAQYARRVLIQIGS
ncbi:MAG TPA: OmpA family protein [Acidocella sp.]|nr:OmpA family protein [Acidocella sp.]